MHVSHAKHSYMMRDYQESMTTGQSDPYVPLCFADITIIKYVGPKFFWVAILQQNVAECQCDLDLWTPKSIGVFLSLSSICVWSIEYQRHKILSSMKFQQELQSSTLLYNMKATNKYRGMSKIQSWGNMTYSVEIGLNIRTNASSEWDKTRCLEEYKASSAG